MKSNKFCKNFSLARSISGAGARAPRTRRLKIRKEIVEEGEEESDGGERGGAVSKERERALPAPLQV